MDSAPDFTLYADGPFPTVYLLRPISKQAKAWVEENLPTDALILGSGVVVEHRYIRSILEGVKAEGLIVVGE